MLDRSLKKFQLIIIGIIGMLLITLGGVLSFASQDKTIFYFLDIGQGDATLITMPGDIQVIIDGGPDDTLLEHFSVYMPFYDRTIEAMVLTHAHADHMDGLIELAKRYTVDTFFYSGVPYVSDELLQILEAQGTDIIKVNTEMTIELTNAHSLELLFPDRELSPIEYEDLNDSSIVARFVHNNIEVLFTGDAPKEVEHYLVEEGVDIAATILQIGHHGSKTSTDSRFVEAVNPIFAIISVGINRYGHPHPRTLATLEERGVHLLRTDQEGDIIFISDGNTILRSP